MNPYFQFGNSNSVTKKIRRNLFGLLVLCGLCFGQTVNTNILPGTTGLNLGSPNQRWNVWAQNLNISGTCTLNGGSCLGGNGGNVFNGVGFGSSYQDVQFITKPSNPAAGICRLYLDNTTFQFSGINSAGASCMPTGGGGGGGTVTAVNSGAGLTGGPITASGTLSVVASYQLPQTCSNTQLPQWNSGSATWGCVNLPTSGITGATTGFGLISVSGSPTLSFTLAGTSGGIPYFSSGTTWASSPALTQYGVVYGGGVGLSPNSTAADTTTTDALFATATAPAFRAIGGSDIKTNSGVTGQTLIANNGSFASFASPSLVDSVNSPVTSAGYTIACDTGTAIVDRAHTVRFKAGASAPVVPLSSASGCSGLVTTVIDEVGSLTFGRTGSDTFSVYNGSTASTGQTSFGLTIGQYATLNQAATGIWEVRIMPGSGSGFPSSTSLYGVGLTGTATGAASSTGAGIPNPLFSPLLTGGSYATDRGKAIHDCLTANTNSVSGDWCDARGEVATSIPIHTNMFYYISDFGGTNASGGGVYLPSGALTIDAGQYIFGNNQTIIGDGVGTGNGGKGPTSIQPSGSYAVGTGGTWNPFLLNWGVPGWANSTSGFPGPYSSTIRGGMQLNCNGQRNTAGWSMFSGQDGTSQYDMGVQNCPVANLIGGSHSSSNGISLEHAYMLHNTGASCIAGTTVSGGTLWTIPSTGWSVNSNANGGIVVMDAPTGGDGGNASHADLVPGVGIIIGQYADNNGTGTSHGIAATNGTGGTNINGVYRVGAVGDVVTLTGANVVETPNSPVTGVSTVVVTVTNDFGFDLQAQTTQATGASPKGCSLTSLINSGFTAQNPFSSGVCTGNALVYFVATSSSPAQIATDLNGATGLIVAANSSSFTAVINQAGNTETGTVTGTAGSSVGIDSNAKATSGVSVNPKATHFTKNGQIAFTINAVNGADSCTSGCAGTITALSEGVEANTPSGGRELGFLTGIATSCHAANSEFPLHEVTLDGNYPPWLHDSHFESSYGAGVAVGENAATQAVRITRITPVTNIGYIGNNGGTVAPSFESAGIKLSNNFGQVLNATIEDNPCLNGANAPTYCIEDQFQGNNWTSANNPVMNYWTDGSGVLGGDFSNGNPTDLISHGGNGVGVWAGQFWGVSNGTENLLINGLTGNATIHNLTINGTCTGCSGGSTALSSITASTGATSIANGNNNETWTDHLIGSTNAFDLKEASAGVGTGALLGLTTLANSTDPLLNITQNSITTAANPGTSPPNVENVITGNGGPASSGNNIGGNGALIVNTLGSMGVFSGAVTQNMGVNHNPMFGMRNGELDIVGGPGWPGGAVSGLSASGNGTTATLTSSSNFPLYFTTPIGITITGCSNSGFNATNVDIASGGTGTTSLTYANSTNSTATGCTATIADSGTPGSMHHHSFLSPALRVLNPAITTSTVHQDMEPTNWDGSVWSTVAIAPGTFALNAGGTGYLGGGSGTTTVNLSCGAQFSATVSSGVITALTLQNAPNLPAGVSIPFAGAAFGSSCATGTGQSLNNSGSGSGATVDVNGPLGAQTYGVISLEHDGCAYSAGVWSHNNASGVDDLLCTTWAPYIGGKYAYNSVFEFGPPGTGIDIQAGQGGGTIAGILSPLVLASTGGWVSAWASTATNATQPYDFNVRKRADPITGTNVTVIGFNANSINAVGVGGTTTGTVNIGSGCADGACSGNTNGGDGYIAPGLTSGSGTTGKLHEGTYATGASSGTANTFQEVFQLSGLTQLMAAGTTLDAATNGAIISNAMGGDAQVSTSDTLTGSVLGANTQGFFLTHTTTLGATSADTIDGTHRGIRIEAQFDYTATATVPTFQLTLFACPSANFTSSNTAPCSSGQVALYTHVAAAPGATTSTQGFMSFYITASHTNGTLNISRHLVQGSFTGSAAVTTPTAVACGATCTGSAYVLYMGEKFGSNAASNLVTLISLDVPYIH